MKTAAIVPFLLALSACSGQPYALRTPPATPDEPLRYQVFIVSHGWHTGLIVPAGQIEQAVPELKERFGDTAYYEIGWGDKGFYQSEEITTALTLQAMFWSEGAVMHVVAVPVAPHTFFQNSEIVSLCLTDAQAASFASFISNSFARDSQGRVVRLKDGIYGNSQFYDGEGRYYLMNTCNKWTAKGLQSAGIEISPTFALTSESVMEAVRPLRQECQSAAPAPMPMPHR